MGVVTAVRSAAAIAALLAAAQASAANKCTMADGSIVYQDAPCVGAKQADRIGPAPQQRQAPGQRSQADRPAEPIAWTGSREQDLIRAEAVLDAIRTQGQRCEWAVKVLGPAEVQTRCRPFAAQFGEGAAWSQVSDKVTGLMQQDRAWAETQLPAFRRIAALMTDVRRYQEVVLAHLKTR